MKRFPTKWAIAAVLGGSVWALSAGPAAAQFFPGGFGFRPPVTPFMGSPFFGSPFMGSPYLGAGYSSYGLGTYSNFNPYTRTFATYQYPTYVAPYGYTSYNPVTGRVMSYNYTVALPYNPYGYGGGGGYSVPYATYGGTATSGYGGYSYSTNPVTNQQLRLLRAASYQASNSGGGYADPPPTYSPRWTTAAPPGQPAGAAGKPADVNEGLLTASGNEVLSGRALNALAAEIRTLEEKGAKADAPLLPPDVLSRVAFDGPGSGLLAAARAGKPTFPEPLTGDAFADLRADLGRHYAAVVEPFGQGKPADPAAADRLAAAARKAKEAPAVRSLPADDQAAAAKFLVGLGALAKEAKDPSLTGASPKWGAMGATASEFVRHVTRHKLQVAPAPAGSEEAYSALHRGLAGYYAALARAKK
jgi:hypothetical protein